MGEKCVDGGGSTKRGKDTGGCYNTYQNNTATTISLLVLRGLLLRELVQDGESLVDLGVHRIRRLQEVQKLRVVHLEQHAGDLARELRLGAIWIREQTVRLKTYADHTYGAIFM